MMFNAGIQPQGAYLLVAASGDAELPELCALADFPAAVARYRGATRALFDLLALRPRLTPDEHVRLGQHIVAALANFERVAVVLAEADDRLAADLAGQQGLVIRSFATLKEANDWLVADA